MKKQLLFLTVMLLSVFYTQAQQISEYYRFEELTYSYVTFTGTEIIVGDSDDGEENIPLGFNFPYNGTTYNSVNVDVNGAVSFTNSSVSYTNNFGSTDVDRVNVIAPLWDDMQKLDAEGSKIQYLQFSGGTKIEWSNVTWRYEGSTVSFTLYFYTNGNIGFWYGPNNSTEDRTASIGFNAGTSGTDFVSVTPGSPASLSTEISNNSISTADYPGEDKFYLFKYGPENNECSNAISLTVENMEAPHIVSTLLGANDDNDNGYEDVWFTATVPYSGNINFETFQFEGSDLTQTYIRAFSGACGSLAVIASDYNSGTNGFSKIELTGQTPGDLIYFNVEQYINTDPNDKFEVLAYEPPPVNDECSNAIHLTVGTSFDSNSIEGTLGGATSIGTTYPYSQVWYEVTVPPSGSLIIETGQAEGSPMDDTYMHVLSGTCGYFSTIETNDNGNGSFAKVELTGLTPGVVIYVEVDKDANYTGVLAEFMISAYEIPPVNNDCANAIDLTVGTDFDSNSIEGTLAGATITAGGSQPEVWFTATVPASGNLTIETDEAVGAVMHDTYIRAKTGGCASLTQIAYSDDDGNGSFSKIELIDRTPGEVIYIEVDNDYENSDPFGTFMVSAYDLTVSVNTLNAESISIFPNPANYFLNVKSESMINSISIFDISGKEVTNINPKAYSYEVNVSNLKQGVYFIKIINENGTTQNKFMKK